VNKQQSAFVKLMIDMRAYGTSIGIPPSKYCHCQNPNTGSKATGGSLRDTTPQTHTKGPVSKKRPSKAVSESDARTTLTTSQLGDMALSVYNAYPLNVGKGKGLRMIVALLKKSKNPEKLLLEMKTCLGYYIELVEDERAKGFEQRWRDFDTWARNWDHVKEPPDTKKRIHQKEQQERKKRLHKRREVKETEPRHKPSTKDFDALRNSVFKVI